MVQGNRVTELLLDWSRGDRDALDRLLPLVQESLHDIARGHLRRERPDHSLETSALVNELYLRLVDQRQVTWRGRAHFVGVAAQIMRDILIDHARRKQSEKRGGGWTRVTLSRAVAAADDEDRIDRILLDEALTRREAILPQPARVVEPRYFAGEETAETMRISAATVKPEWGMAKAWLRREVTEQAS
ncbi:MAG: RNA polymerase subunit sigma-70 [Acidobacteria bacterium]|nr:RNA polymerase subunit sigma-70 [Acidobacteriota bacterium]